MSRVRKSVASRARRKKVIKLASGYRYANRFRIAKQLVEKALQYQYRDRRNRKRDMRALWIVRINIALREMGLKYSSFMNKLSNSDIDINRKMLADLAVKDLEVFKGIVSKVISK